MLGEDFQYPAGDSESSLGGLIRISGSADDDSLTLEQSQVTIAAEAQRSAQDFRCVFLDENIPLEREPGRQLVVCIAELLDHLVIVGGALHHPAVRVTRVAVGAPKSAADVGIDRPESHACCFWSIENALRRRGVVPDVLLLADDRELAGL